MRFRRAGVVLLQAAPRPLVSSVGGGDGEVEEPCWFGQLECFPDGLLARRGGRALGDLSVGGGEGDQVQPVELVGDVAPGVAGGCLLYTSDAADDLLCVDLGGRRIIKKKKTKKKNKR